MQCWLGVFFVNMEGNRAVDILNVEGPAEDMRAPIVNLVTVATSHIDGWAAVDHDVV